MILVISKIKFKYLCVKNVKQFFFFHSIYGHSNPLSMVTIGLASLPTERYKRNVIRGKLDLVVSMGGTAGLFVGASLLSFVEIFYYFIVRPCYRLRSKETSTKQPDDDLYFYH